MSFDVPADAYLRFMGRWSEPLTQVFLDEADVSVTGQVLDVGCGPGVLTAVLVDRYGAAAVAAVDPSPSFVDATRERFPDVAVRQGGAESLPYDDAAFDAALAQLVVHFMSDPVGGFREMGRVTRSGGVVGACVWDHGGGGSPLSIFWSAAGGGGPAAPHEAALPGTQEGQLASYARDAGLSDVRSSSLTVSQHFESFDEWWAPYLFGVGPLGAYVRTLDADHLRAVQERCRARLPEAPFDQHALAWNVRALVRGSPVGRRRLGAGGRGGLGPTLRRGLPGGRLPGLRSSRRSGRGPPRWGARRGALVRPRPGA